MGTVLTRPSLVVYLSIPSSFKTIILGYLPLNILRTFKLHWKVKSGRES